MLKKSQVIAAGLIVIVLSVTLSYAVHAALPDSLRPAGTTRYAVAQSAAPVSTTSTSYVDLPGLSTSITIPAGKTGDVMIMLCGMTYGTANTLAQAMIGGALASPADVSFREPNLAGESQCAQFYRLNIPEGTRTVRAQWRASAGTSNMWERSMIVTVNIH